LSTDLSVGLISVLTDIIWRLTVTWHAGHIACKLIRFSQVRERKAGEKGVKPKNKKLLLFIFYLTVLAPTDYAVFFCSFRLFTLSLSCFPLILLWFYVFCLCSSKVKLSFECPSCIF